MEKTNALIDECIKQNKKEATKFEPSTGFQSKAIQLIEETNMRIEKFFKEQKEKNKSEFEGLQIRIPPTHQGINHGTSPSSTTKNDNVNSPKHYCKGGLECIQVIKAQLTPEQNKGYLYGNVLKYMWRWQDKNGLEDLRKAEHYLKWLIEEVEKNEKG